jgi:hypothetical protein
MRPLPPVKPALTEPVGSLTHPHPAGAFPRRAMR